MTISTSYCQSCSMPLSTEMAGTEKDGSKSTDYCLYCYKDGVFADPDMTLDQMKALVRKEMEKMKMDVGLIEKSVQNLRHLKRWSS